MLIYTEEALTIVPNDIRWQALREQVTKQMNQEKPLGSDEQFPKSVVQDRTIKEADQKVEQMETMVMPTNPISIFIAYALNDAELCAALKNHLTTLIYEHRLRIWYDHDISPGQETMKIIKERLNASHMIILLVSGHFLGSEYHRWQTELALEMHRVGTKRIIPILLKPSDWETTPLRELQALPKDKRPVTAWPNKDEALVNIVRGIRSVVEDLRVLS
jgi:TIR domain